MNIIHLDANHPLLVDQLESLGIIILLIQKVLKMKSKKKSLSMMVL